MSMSRGRSFAPVVAALAVAVLAVLPNASEAQAHRNTAVDSLRQIQEMAPSFGPVGTEVHISTLNLPVQAKVHVGYGATRTGFEALFEVQQGVWGDIEATLTVPETAPWDRAISFVAFNAVFSPIGLSEPFHVVNENGHVRRTGTVTDELGECVSLRDEDGYLYALTGDITGALSNGDGIVVEGVYSPSSPCHDGSTIAISSFTPSG